MATLIRASLLTLGLLVAVHPAVRGQAAPPADRIPVHDSFTVNSRAVGEKRLINVHVPVGYGAQATSKFPVLYMPDGGLDEDFPHVVNTVDSLIALKEIRPVIVVGIPNTERRRDLTGPTRVHEDSAIAVHVGGSAAFRRFIRTEVIPEIDRRYRTTTERSLVGESLAGLFVVETFLLDRALFTHYVAFDPSLWWNKGALAAAAPGYLKGSETAARSLYLATSNVEEIAEPTARLAKLASTVPGGRLRASYLKRTDLTHDTIFRALAPAGLISALH